MRSINPNSFGILGILAAAFLITQFSAVQAQNQSNLSFTVHTNTASTPMLGVNYDITDRARIRASLGYFRSDQFDTPECISIPVKTLMCVSSNSKVNQFSGAISAIYRVTEWSILSAYTGGELQYLYADAPALNGYEEVMRTANDRLSMGGLVGLSVQPVSWLSIFGEVGFGYVHGMSVSAANYDISLQSRSSHWGLTHAGPGVRVTF